MLDDETINALTESVSKIIESNLIDGVIKRLDSFGYTVTENDVWSVGFCIQKVENSIKNDCNISDIPEGAYCEAVDMVCGEFLSVKYSTGQLELSTLDLNGALASVNIGDTSVSFDNNTSDDVKLASLVNSLLASGRGAFVCYRRIKW